MLSCQDLSNIDPTWPNIEKNTRRVLRLFVVWFVHTSCAQYRFRSGKSWSSQVPLNWRSQVSDKLISQTIAKPTGLLSLLLAMVSNSNHWPTRHSYVRWIAPTKKCTLATSSSCKVRCKKRCFICGVCLLQTQQQMFGPLHKRFRSDPESMLHSGHGHDRFTSHCQIVCFLGTGLQGQFDLSARRSIGILDFRYL